jgi:hypothetical protein
VKHILGSFESCTREVVESRKREEDVMATKKAVEPVWNGPAPREPGGIPDDTTLANMDTFGLRQLAADNGLDYEETDDNERLIKTLSQARA